MKSLHDLGGMQGFGPVWAEPEGKAFHSDAERGAFRLMMGLMMRGWCDTDGFRADVETLPVQIYARECFPANYLAGMEKQLAERGLLKPGDIEAWMRGIKPQDYPTAPPPVIPVIDEAPLAALFAVGDIVRLRATNPPGHTRLPGYLRGQVGTIAARRGLADFPDMLAARIGRRPQPVYTVEFKARDVWGPGASANDRLSAEIFQDYIEAAIEGAQ